MVEKKGVKDKDDALGIEQDPEIQKHFTQPQQELVVLFSGIGQKYGFFRKSERQIVITNLCFYVFKKRVMKRVTPIQAMLGLTKLLNTKGAAAHEFVVHVSRAPDYRLLCER